MLQWDDSDYRDVPRVPVRPLTWRDGLRIAGEAALLFALLAFLFVVIPMMVQP